MDDGRHDFDFLFGSWHVENRRLVRRLVGSTQWENFETTLETRPILGGMGNVDAFADGRGWEAMTLRLFDPGERHWSIWWAATTRPGHLDPPGFGAGFRDDPRAIARFRSEEAPNDYPALPVREGVKAIVSLVRFGDAAERDRHVDAARSDGAEAFRVAPTRRSLLR